MKLSHTSKTLLKEAKKHLDLAKKNSDLERHYHLSCACFRLIGAATYSEPIKYLTEAKTVLDNMNLKEGDSLIEIKKHVDEWFHNSNVELNNDLAQKMLSLQINRAEGILKSIENLETRFYLDLKLNDKKEAAKKLVDLKKQIDRLKSESRVINPEIREIAYDTGKEVALDLVSKSLNSPGFIRRTFSSLIKTAFLAAGFSILGALAVVDEDVTLESCTLNFRVTDTNKFNEICLNKPCNNLKNTCFYGANSLQGSFKLKDPVEFEGNIGSKITFDYANNKIRTNIAEYYCADFSSVNIAISQPLKIPIVLGCRTKFSSLENRFIHSLSRITLLYQYHRGSLEQQNLTPTLEYQ